MMSGRKGRPAVNRRELSSTLNPRRIGSGRGRPVIAVHGALSDQRIYLPLATALGRHRPVITYDQRYFGARPWVDGGQGFSRRVHEDDLIGLVEALECGPVDLLAWSYGGDVAMHAILRRPELFRAVVLFDPSIGAILRHVSGADAATAQFLAALRPAMDLLAAGQTQAAAKAFICGVTGRSETEIEAFGPLVSSIIADNARTLAPFLKALAGDHGAPLDPEAVGRLPIRSLILTGERSLLRYRMIAQWLGRRLPAARLITVAGATHFGPWEQAKAIAELAERFLRRFEGAIPD
ncbi:alpha/beta fold hydrolase [Chelativorans intermedius]|uniref:Alpha/beta fold hydrolase n=2 Tax=Chelativorans intermedius TaxID=515947 RepID=A0ABV6D2L3_9HYPH